MGSMGYAGVLIALWLAFGVLGATAAVWLVRQIWRRRATTTLAKKLASSLIAGGLGLVSVGTLLGLVKALGAVGGESIDPAEKARGLAEGIAEAMNFTALGLAIGVPSTIVAALLARFGKRRQ